MMGSEVSERLLDQRLRNRIIESIEILADGDEGVWDEGAAEYFEIFYDQLPHRDEERHMWPNAAISEHELAALLELSALVDQACDATPRNVDEDGLIASGWPKRIKPVAERALKLFVRRGRFSEDVEELEPGRPS